jgi:hypothetical protein
LIQGCVALVYRMIGEDAAIFLKLMQAGRFQAILSKKIFEWL